MLFVVVVVVVDTIVVLQQCFSLNSIFVVVDAAVVCTVQELIV